MSDQAELVETPAFCSQAEFARLNSWSPSYVTKLKQEGRLVFTPDGKVDVQASLLRIQQGTGAPERASAPAVSSALQDLQAQEKRLDIQRKTREEQQAIGELLDATAVLDAVNDAGALFRSQLEAWPERLSPQIAALGSDEGRIRALLADHVEAALNEFVTRLTGANAGTKA